MIIKSGVELRDPFVLVENGKYNILIGSSSRDIRLCASIIYNDNDDYTMKRTGEDMIG